MRSLLVVLCVSLSGCMHGCGGDASDDHEERAAAEPSAGAEGSGPVRVEASDESEDFAEPPPIEPPD